MIRKRLSRDESQAQTRRRLLDAARAVFARNGYRGASVEAIAAEAGYSKGAVYSNFASKEDILLELKIAYADAGFEELDQLVGRLAVAKGKYDDAAKVIRKWLETFMSDTEWFVLGIELQLHARRNPDFAERYGTLNDCHRMALAAIFKRLFTAFGKAPKDCGLVADALIGLSLGLSLESGSDPVDVMMATVASFFAAAPDAKSRA
jgi:AcrR family transcriptional regulator